MQKWEYFVFYSYQDGQQHMVPVSDGPMEVEMFLERCGASGWELVSLVPVAFRPDAENQLIMKLVESAKLMGVLKRPKK
jgi:hypothetical protein